MQECVYEVDAAARHALPLRASAVAPPAVGLGGGTRAASLLTSSVERSLVWAEMDGKFVFRRAAQTLVMAAVGMCLENQVSLETDVDLVALTQW